MDTLTSIKAFRQVVESGSFVAAAERLAQLELGSLGIAPRGTLRITAPSWVAGQRLANLLKGYRDRYPDVLVDISFEDQAVDLVEGGYDLAIRLSRGTESLPAGLIARPLRTATFYVAASHEYLEPHGVPHSPDDLVQHDFVAVGNQSSLSLAGPGGVFDVPIRVVLRYRSMAGVANAIAAGIGIAPVSDGGDRRTTARTGTSSAPLMRAARQPDAALHGVARLLGCMLKPLGV